MVTALFKVPLPPIIVFSESPVLIVYPLFKVTPFAISNFPLVIVTVLEVFPRA